MVIASLSLNYAVIEFLLFSTVTPALFKSFTALSVLVLILMPQNAPFLSSIEMQ